MARLAAFNPHEQSAAVVRAVATGRGPQLEAIIAAVRGNLAAPNKQHLIVSAPRGSGKSFLLRHVEIEVADLAEREGLPVAMALLAEELPHVKEPATLLAEILRTFSRAPADSVAPRWAEDDGAAWDAAVADLDAALDAHFGAGGGLLVAGVENFDQLLRKTFARSVQAGRLREFLTRSTNRVMFLGTSAHGGIDRDYDKRLFKAFDEVALPPWTIEQCQAFFAAQRRATGKPELTDETAARARAVATFIGGTPRLAMLTGEALLHDETLRAAGILEQLVDALTPYYKARIEALPTRAQLLLDAILRGGEKCSATEVARRVSAPGQSAIAGPLDELKKDLVVGERAPDSAEVLLRVGDRIFAHYYRRRILSHGKASGTLDELVNLLADFYTPAAQRQQAILPAADLAIERCVLQSCETDKPEAGRAFGGIAGSATQSLAWPRLSALIGDHPATAENLARQGWGLDEPGLVIAESIATDGIERALALTRHFVAALASAIDPAPDAAAGRLWRGVLVASAKRIALETRDHAALEGLADIFAAHRCVPAGSAALLRAASAYHSSGRNVATLARLDPDLETALIAVFAPREPVRSKSAGRRGQSSKARKGRATR